MAKIEGLTPAEIAAATGLGIFTVYSRLKAARVEFERHLSRLNFLDDARVPRRRSPRSRAIHLPQQTSRTSSAA
jgi:hypothetical protein